MSDNSPALPSGPVTESARITSLDLIRGLAVLGILLMNVVSFKLGQVPYWNISAGGSATWLDWSIAVFGEIFVDQKFMGLFSLLFGAGMMLFIDRVSTRERHPVLLNLWRNALLLIIGLIHFLLWDGDILVAYALSSVVLLSLRRLPSRVLVAVGVFLFLLPIAIDVWLQSLANATGDPLAGIWSQPDAEIRFGGGLVLLNYFLRALGMILIGAGLYRLGFLQGDRSARTYQLTATLGLTVGLALAAAGVILVAINQFSNEVAFVGNIPNNLGTIPASLGYLSLIILWNRRPDHWLKRRLRAAGRMALTNYLSQTILAVLILTILLADLSINRSGLLLFVFAVWLLQLWWSQTWLNHFRFGPAEWLWRVATYRRGQPLRRT